LTPYETSARYYDDAYAAKADLVDLPFYLDLARRVGGPVLELACGTGRVLLPIAREGIAIHGVDFSRPMLEILRGKLHLEPPGVRDLVSVTEADMRTFRSGERYPLVLIPFRPMQHMFTVEDQLAALTTAALHLRADGVLAFDVFFPRFDLIDSGIGEEQLDLEWLDPANPGMVVRRYLTKESVDKVSQSFSATFVFRTYEGGKLVSEETEPLRMSYYTYPHLRALFMLAGLEIVEEFGSFDRTALDNSAEQMIFLLRARAPAPP
jgi:SAM-dependent methyltransferase